MWGRDFDENQLSSLTVGVFDKLAKLTNLYPHPCARLYVCTRVTQCLVWTCLVRGHPCVGHAQCLVWLGTVMLPCVRLHFYYYD